MFVTYLINLVNLKIVSIISFLHPVYSQTCTRLNNLYQSLDEYCFYFYVNLFNINISVSDGNNKYYL